MYINKIQDHLKVIRIQIFLTILANSMYDQCVVMHGKPKSFMNHIFGLLNPWIAEFDEFSADIADHMIVLLGAE